MIDMLEASLAAADDLLGRLEDRIPRGGILFRLPSVKQARESLLESVEALRQWREGQQLLAERLRTILQTAGVRRIDSIGRVFDPSLHRAVSIERREGTAPGTVIGEELKGYMLEGKILRYAEVIVAKNE
jgi:molecular chaperone GrpE